MESFHPNPVHPRELSPPAKKSVSQITIIELFFIIVLAYIIVNLWDRFLNNFFYNALGFNKDSAFVTFFIAIFFTVIIVLFFIFAGNLLDGAVENNIFP